MFGTPAAMTTAAAMVAAYTRDDLTQVLALARDVDQEGTRLELPVVLTVIAANMLRNWASARNMTIEAAVAALVDIAVDSALELTE